MRPVFATLASPHTKLLAASIREFGGSLSDALIWVFGNADAEGIEVHPMPDAGEFPFADKVAACAAAERLASGRFDTLVWIDSECLVVNPPVLYGLEPPFRAAFRPVHIRNVGSPAGEAPDTFWSRIYKEAGQPSLEVESFVDGQRLRAYFNTHAFSVDPGMGLMERWARAFKVLAADEDFLSGPCSDSPHRVFLHQAVLSALAATELGQSGIRILPPEYNYPYNLQGRVPPGKMVESFDTLATVVVEGRDLDPAKMTDIRAGGRFSDWLSSRSI